MISVIKTIKGKTMATKNYNFIETIFFCIFLGFIILFIIGQLNLFQDNLKDACYRNRHQIASTVASYNKKFKISSKIDLTYAELLKAGYYFKFFSSEKNNIYNYEIIDNGGSDISIICPNHGEYKYIKDKYSDI